jgi:hypothetical protein
MRVRRYITTRDEQAARDDISLPGPIVVKPIVVKK